MVSHRFIPSLTGFNSSTTMALARSALGSGARRLDGRAVAVDADNRGDIEIQFVEAGDQFLYRGRSPDLAVARADMIRFDDDLFSRKINDDQDPRRETSAGDRFRRAAAPSRQHARAAAEGFDDDGAFGFFPSCRVGACAAPWPRERKNLARRTGDNGRAFGHEGANAAGMIEVMMRRNHVADRFVGKSLFDRLAPPARCALRRAGLRRRSNDRASRRRSSRGSCRRSCARRWRVESIRSTADGRDPGS